ncbi:MAG: hypothetical protein ACR2M1_02820 [Gemmatimonadaceae bacterium]
MRAEIDGYLRSTSRAGEIGRGGPALDLHRRDAERFGNRMMLGLQQFGSPWTAVVIRRGVVASATNILLASLVERYSHAGAPLGTTDTTSDGEPIRDRARAVGEAIYSVYGKQISLADRLEQWRHPKSIADVRSPSIPSVLGDMGKWATDFCHQVEVIERVAPDFGAFLEIETALPSKVALHDRDTVAARVSAFREFEAQLPAVERAERNYILDVTAPEGGHTASPRPPLIDVARMVTYRRIRNHADPIAVLNTNLAAVGIEGAMQVARAGEIALVRRYDELRYDRLQGADGDVFRRPAGFDVHPRYREMAQHAVETGSAPDFLDDVLPAFRDGERDPEYLRIDRYVSRLVEADLVRSAIGMIRPLTRGELINEPKWSATLVPIAELLFEEQEGARPLLNASGQMVDWQDLVRRHPDANVAPAAMDMHSGMTAIEQSWILPALEDAEAYMPARTA